MNHAGRMLLVGAFLVVVGLLAWVILERPAATGSGATVASVPGSTSGGEAFNANATPFPSGVVSPGGPQASAPGNPGGPVGVSGNPLPPPSPGAGTPAMPMPGGGQNLHLPEYLAAASWLETQGKAAMTPEQARKVIPLLNRYKGSYNTIPEARAQVLAVLNEKQRAWLEAKVPKSKPKPDPNRTAEQILLKSASDLKDALEKR